MRPLSIALAAFFALLMSPRILAETGPRYRDYIDDESGVVKRPEAEGWSDPFGDGVWRSSWFYGSLIVLKAKDSDEYTAISTAHGVTIDDAVKFLTYFAANNIDGDEWTLPKNATQKFSRDQLVPLMYLLAAVHAHEPTLHPIAKTIVEKLVAIVKDKGAVSDSTQGKVRENLRYVIDVLADKFGVNYVDGTTRGIYKIAFSGALTADSLQVQLPGDAATQDDFSVFNRLSLVSLQCIIWGKDDGDVKVWRANYKQHADKGWGPSFRIVAGRTIDTDTINVYRNKKVARTQDNDIILAQRPKKFLNGTFPPTNGDQLVLDYVILNGLTALWR